MMKMTKKLTALLLTALMLLSLSACGGDKKDDESKKEYTVGTVENGVYTSEFAGVTCTLDSTWSVLNDAEIAQIVGYTVDMTSDEELKKSLSDGKTLFDMYAMATDSSTLNITVGDLGAIYGKVVDAKSVAEASAKELPEAFKNMGFTDVTTEVVTLTFAGAQHPAIVLKGNYLGVPMYETLVCMKVGNYTYNITACSYGTDRTAEILNFFSAL